MTRTKEQAISPDDHPRPAGPSQGLESAPTHAATRYPHERQRSRVHTRLEGGVPNVRGMALRGSARPGTHSHLHATCSQRCNRCVKGLCTSRPWVLVPRGTTAIRPRGRRRESGVAVEHDQQQRHAGRGSLVSRRRILVGRSLATVMMGGELLKRITNTSGGKRRRRHQANTP